MFKNKAEQEYEEHKIHLRSKYQVWVSEYDLAILVLKDYQSNNKDSNLQDVINRLTDDRDFYEDILQHTW